MDSSRMHDAIDILKKDYIHPDVMPLFRAMGKSRMFTDALDDCKGRLKHQFVDSITNEIAAFEKLVGEKSEVHLLIRTSSTNYLTKGSNNVKALIKPTRFTSNDEKNITIDVPVEMAARYFNPLNELSDIAKSAHKENSEYLIRCSNLNDRLVKVAAEAYTNKFAFLNYLLGSCGDNKVIIRVVDNMYTFGMGAQDARASENHSEPAK